MEYNNDPKILDEVLHLRAENRSLYRDIQSHEEMNEFLRNIINTLISSRNA